MSNYVIRFSALKESGSVADNLRMLISPDNVKISNVQMLRQVVEGESILEWEYVEEKEPEVQRQEETDEQLEKRLEEELRK